MPAAALELADAARMVAETLRVKLDRLVPDRQGAAVPADLLIMLAGAAGQAARDHLGDVARPGRRLVRRRRGLGGPGRKQALGLEVEGQPHRGAVRERA